MAHTRLQNFVGAAATVVTLGAILTLMAWFNDWFALVPSDLAQVLWAFNLVVWPALAFFGMRALFGKRAQPVGKTDDLKLSAAEEAGIRERRAIADAFIAAREAEGHERRRAAQATGETP